MRVIEERYIHEKEAFCNHCGATLGYYPKDVNHYIPRDFYYVKCLCCGKYIEVDKPEDIYYNIVDGYIK